MRHRRLGAEKRGKLQDLKDVIRTNYKRSWLAASLCGKKGLGRRAHKSVGGARLQGRMIIRKNLWWRSNSGVGRGKLHGWQLKG